MLDFTNKTVDQLWQDIKKEEDTNNNNNSSSSNDNTKQPPTLGEMTLEDFLAKAGILSQDKTSTESVELSSQQNFKQQLAQWMQYQIQPFQQQQQQPVFMPDHHHPDHQIVGDMAYSEAQMTVSSDTPGRKRSASGGDLLEKTIERRQKRMIKNRESAARSRARKQAYTEALENKVSHLEEENERLNREQEAEKALPYVPPSEPKYQLRRTSSTSF
ncbi:ABSCISIC ACID-INSENSITIVE 5-like protein 2 [Bidens hawaiensis]|uniref:ABSCISIC ACID-INSENSITIVE 5-like protein 2 n=1 Tax=Bidens hawaiensis TaxID=980011 RepID=UPI00404B29D3